MDERMDAPSGGRIVELLRKAAMGGFEGSKNKVMDDLAQLIGCDGGMHFQTIGKLADMVEEAIQREHETAYDKGYDAGFASADDWLGQHEDDMAEHGWYRALDGDKKPIRIGDVMDGVNKYDTLQEVTGVVTTISFDATLDPDDSASVGIRVWADDHKSYRVVYIDPHASVYRHHKQPTVEDVLREFAEKITDSQIPNMHPTYEEAIAEYAAKLMLKED